MIEMTHVEGENKGKIALYALSTCGWCRKTKKFLEKLGAEYSYVDMDKLIGDAKKEAEKEVANWNPICSYPTIIINDKKCIVGFDDDKILEELGL